MAAITKFKAKELAGHLKHDFRTNFAELKGIVKFKNEDIDADRTKDNYSLGDTHSYKEAWAKYKDRMEHIYHMNRSDLVVAASWSITVPKSISSIENSILREAYTREFMEASYEYCASLYGAENIISANAHFDEGNWVKNEIGEKTFRVGEPHLQVVLIPTVEAKDRGEKFRESKFERKVNANECLNRFHLQHWHPNFQKFMDKNYPELNAKVHTGVTGGKNIKVEALKELTNKTGLTLDQVNELKMERDLLKENLIDATSKIAELEEQVKTLQMTKETTVEWGSNGWNNEVTKGDIIW